MDQRITIISGAGAMVDFTPVSTETLTEKVIKNCKKYRINGSSDTSLADVICNTFLQIYRGEISSTFGLENCSGIDELKSVINFESICHVLELLPDYMNSGGYKRHTSAFRVFTELKQDFEDVKPDCAAREIIRTINDDIYAYDSDFADKGKDFSKFFGNITKKTGLKLDIFNLNYDTWVEQSLCDCNDGYVEIAGYENKMKRFDVNEYFKDDGRHTVSHLHGQIYFGYPEPRDRGIRRNAFQEPCDTMYKYADFAEARECREQSIRSSDHTQSGENLSRTNIVTGLMKTDKLLWNPLILYHNKLTNSLLSNQRLILVGYGFSGLYINNLLLHYNARHFNKRKMVMMDYISDKDLEQKIGHPFKPSEKADFTDLMFKEDFWYRKQPCDHRKPVYCSNDKMAYIFINGFRDVISNRLSDVIEFIS